MTFYVFTPEELQGGFLEVFNLFFGQFPVNLPEECSNKINVKNPMTTILSPVKAL